MVQLSSSNITNLNEEVVDTGSDQTSVNLSSIQTTGPSETAILTSLFGWSLPAQSKTMQLESISANLTRSISRSASVAPSSPSPTRSSSFRSVVKTQESISESSHQFRRLSSSLSRHSEYKEKLLLCEFCQRKVGLWAFTNSNSSNPDIDDTSLSTSSPNLRHRTQTKRHFDLLKEHRSYCPYVVRSSALPSLPTASVSSYKD
jgi:hypothetical protein